MFLSYSHICVFKTDESRPAYSEHPERHDGPHELSGTAPSPTDANSPRPFSFTDSESGYRPDQKIDPMLQ